VSKELIVSSKLLNGIISLDTVNGFTRLVHF
jgi:hypothetical protein